MKKIYSILAAALLTTGALLTTACSGDDDAVVDNITLRQDSETIQFTATLAPKDGATTRAITTGTDASNKEILNVAWAAGEEVAVYYQKSDDTYATATATVGEPNADGSASITASLDSPMNGGTVKFVYPATLHNGAGDIDESKLLNDQRGFLTYNGSGTDKYSISKFFDAATGSGIVSTATGTAVVSGKVKLTNRVCICKISFGLVNGNAITSINKLKKVEILLGDKTYSITPSALKPEHPYIYVALLPCEGAKAIFLAYNGEVTINPETDMTTYEETYMQCSSNVTLDAGKFYRSVSIRLVKGGIRDLSAGSILAGGECYIYQSDNSATENTITIADGATVTIDGVNISTRNGSGIICNGTANIILEGTNTVEGRPAIQAGPAETMLTISGSGSLTATTTNGWYAAIGSSKDGSCGAITISGGTVTVTVDGNEGAGIGSGWKGSCGAITISGGTVTATGGSLYGAGIGSGFVGDCGDITISGGTVTATGGENAPGIGSGSGAALGTNIASCGNITISGTETSVKATKGESASYSIGMGNYGSTCGTITIGGTQYYNGTSFTNTAAEERLATSPLEYPWP